MFEHFRFVDCILGIFSMLWIFFSFYLISNHFIWIYFAIIYLLSNFCLSCENLLIQFLLHAFDLLCPMICIVAISYMLDIFSSIPYFLFNFYLFCDCIHVLFWSLCMIGKIYFDDRLVIFHSWFWLCISCIHWISLVLILYSLFCLWTNPYSYVSTLPYFRNFWDTHPSLPYLFGSFDMHVML